MPPSTAAVVAGCIVYALVWVLLLKDKWPRLPLGRTGSALLGAVLMVALGPLTATEGFACINLPTLALLTGCMLICAHVEQLGLYTLLSKLLSGGAKSSPRAFLVRTGLASAVSSALVTNDTSCIILTPMVLAACKERGLSPAPFLLAVATCANIGSAASPIGNPQNMLVAQFGGLSFREFLATIFLAAAVGVGINLAYIAAVYKQALSPGMEGAIMQHHDEPHASSANATSTSLAATDALQTSAVDVVTVSGEPAASVEPAATAPPATPPRAPLVTDPRRRRALLVILALVPPLLIAADQWIGLGWLSLLLGMALCVAAGGEPEPYFAGINGSLLLFFSGLFVCVGGFNATGVPGAVWDALGPAASVTSASGIFVYSLIILIASNTVSNVPLVLLLGPKLSQLTGGTALLAWTQLAFVSTAAGNLTLLGSVANLIVAAGCKDTYPLTFTEHLRVGLPATLLSCLVGVPLVWGCCALVNGA